MVEEQFPWERGFWADHISEPSHFVIEVIDEPSNGELSEAEEELIGEIFARFGRMDPFKLVDLLHEILPEWKDPNGSRIPITIPDILKAGKRTSAEIKAIQGELDEANTIRSILGASKELR